MEEALDDLGEDPPGKRPFVLVVTKELLFKIYKMLFKKKGE